MPIINSKYKAPLLFRNYHLSTIYASMCRKIKNIVQHRDRLELEDGDFLDIDWSFSPAGKARELILIIHGLEGSAMRPYVQGMAKHFNKNSWDAAAINLRGCSGEINRLYRSYNAGASEDLDAVINHILLEKNYSVIAITGFSLGGNLMLKYLGDNNDLPSQIKAAVAISTPCDLYRSLKMLEEPRNFLYAQRFVKKLKNQLLKRAGLYPGEISREQINSCKSLYEIDDLYTGKAHGFKDAMDYYNKSSALNFIPNIKVPTLLLNAKNDAFLSDSSSPVAMAYKNPNFFLEMPEHGGHVGFLQHKKQTYAEERAFGFIAQFSSLE